MKTLTAQIPERLNDIYQNRCRMSLHHRSSSAEKSVHVNVSICSDIFSMKTVTLLENLILQDCFDQDEAFGEAGLQTQGSS
ncbi:hypothetical protein YC2023_097282 [Brassica napus]